jgi:pyruvate,water dikinase
MGRRYVLDFQEIEPAHIDLVGGKALGLGVLVRIEGVKVPPGFCLTTQAFDRIVAEGPSLTDDLDRLSVASPDEHDRIRELAESLRRRIEHIGIPRDVAMEVENAIARFGNEHAFAVRSSATAEDLPTASFAGQQDTYLNVVGAPAILEHVSRCWASLFSERAITYRLRNGIDNRKVRMAVVVQRMVFPRSAGTLFTADPVSGNRKIVIIEGSVGFGEAVVSGLTNPDAFKVRDGRIIERAIATKHLAIRASSAGGTERYEIESDRQRLPALSDAQAVRLAELGRRIEAHFGQPQDIEWCFADEDFYIVQSRPITTLFPIPERDDEENHVYVSVGHQQMMTDAIRPLGISVWQLSAGAPMFTAGGRLFVDVAPQLASPAARARLLMLAKSDPLIGDALQTIVDRNDFFPVPSDAKPAAPPSIPPASPIETDPRIVDELIAESEASIAVLKREIATKSGVELLDFILADFPELRRILSNPRSYQVFMSAMEASWWLNDKMQEWLGEKSAADVLTQSVPNNVTSEMGLELLDVADVIRRHSAAVAFLETVSNDTFLNDLPAVEGGPEVRDALQTWLDKYGMRGVGEIDITRPRWTERPTMLLPLLLSNVKNFEEGEAHRRFQLGLQQAHEKERDLLSRLRDLPDGARKAEETKQKIDRVRTFIGYREYPKYGKISREFVYKQALLAEAERLVRAGVLRAVEDIFYLTLQELREVTLTKSVDRERIRERQHAFELYQTLMPPRVLTSEGEMLGGSYRRDDVPEGALVGLAVSAGVIEGRARVILRIADARLEPGDILVTRFTDPSWTSLFVGVKGLVTEVGGLMTHGAVIAREYGLPAVVGVEHATELIRDGARIRVNGTDGFVEILS